MEFLETSFAATAVEEIVRTPPFDAVDVPFKLDTTAVVLGFLAVTAAVAELLLPPGCCLDDAFCTAALLGLLFLAVPFRVVLPPL